MSKTAFIFPGQGSQYAGMGKDLHDNFAIARDLFAEADEALGFKLSSLCFSGPDAELKLTANTQPAILTVSVAAHRVLQAEKDIAATFVAGHSLGEYSALVASGALQFADAVRTVRARGTFMQEAVPVGLGSMAALLSVPAEELAAICTQAAQGEVVAPANFNAPGQIVIAGHTSAVNRAIEIAKERGYRKAMLLPVSAPFHCALMKPAADRLAGELSKVAVSSMLTPVVTNVEALPNSNEQRIGALLVSQVCAPVLWEQSVMTMVQSGVTRMIEIGPGKVLSGLVKRICKDVTTVNIEDAASLGQL